MTNTNTKSASRLLLAGLLLGTVALLGACSSPTETSRTTSEQTTTHQVMPTAPMSSSTTTTQTTP